MRQSIMSIKKKSYIILKYIYVYLLKRWDIIIGFNIFISEIQLQL